MNALYAEAERLRVAIDAVVPADDFPSASQAGGRFADLDAGARAAVLDGLVHDPEYVWFAQLVNAGFYADPANGGNDDAVSWRMLGWSPAPAAGWPAEDVWFPDRSPIIRRDQ